MRELKAKHPGTVLMIQSGYKMLFFEEDAKVGMWYLFTPYLVLRRPGLASSQGARGGLLSKAQSVDGHDTCAQARRASEEVRPACVTPSAILIH